MRPGGGIIGNLIYLELPRTAYYTGELVSGAVIIETTRPTSTRGLTLDILGRESTEIRRGGGDSERTYRSRADHVAWRVPLHAEAAVPPGRYRFPFHFQIPVYALPSYAGAHAKVEYSITARLDVPWWPDAVTSTPFYVVYARESVRTFSHPVRFRSGGDGPEIYVELDGDRFFARELIGCRITILRVGDARVRRVYVKLFGGEWAMAENQQETTVKPVAQMDIPMGVIRVGEPFTFEIPIPADLPSSYRGRYSFYSYVLQFGLDIAWARDLIAEAPIVIVR